MGKRRVGYIKKLCINSICDLTDDARMQIAVKHAPRHSLDIALRSSMAFSVLEGDAAAVGVPVTTESVILVI